MSDKYIEHIDSKFDNLIGNIKWAIGIIIVVGVTFGGVVTANTVRSISNESKLERHSLALQEMVTKRQMERLIDFVQLRKDINMVASTDHSEEDIKALWDRLEEIENSVLHDDYGVYYRGAANGEYSDRVKNKE